MKKILPLTLVLLLTFCIHTKAQFIYDKLGKPATEIPYTNIDGSPYLVDGWVSGTVTLPDGSHADAKLKYDAYANQLFFQGKNGETLEFVNKLNGFSLNIGDKGISDLTPLAFIDNLPAVDKQTAASWYQLIADGKIKLLKFYSKEIIEMHNFNSVTKTKSFNPHQAYYILQNSTLIKISPNKKAIAKVLNDHATEIEAWLKTNPINFKSDADLQRFFIWYNLLS